MLAKAKLTYKDAVAKVEAGLDFVVLTGRHEGGHETLLCHVTRGVQEVAGSILRARGPLLTQTRSVRP